MAANSSGSIRPKVLLLVTTAISLASLVWALRDAQLSELGEDLREMNWWWVAIAVIFDIIVYLWHGIRWRLLLRPVVNISYGRTVRAIYVGLFANEILPLRVGEVLRCYLIARGTALPFSVSLSSALVERVFDGIWLCLCLFIVLQITPMPPGFGFLVESGYILLGIVAALGLALGFAMFRKHAARAAFSGKRWLRQFQILLDDLELMGHSRYLIFSFVQSMPYLVLSAVPIYAALHGYGFNFTIGRAFTLMVILRLGSIVPQAPGNLGVFQLLVRECMVKIFGVATAEAARFSLVLWGIVTLPLLAGGLIALSVTGAKLDELRRAAETEAQALGAGKQAAD